MSEEKATVDIAIAATLHQHSHWWGHLVRRAMGWMKAGIEVNLMVSGAARLGTTYNINLDMFGAWDYEAPPAQAPTDQNRNALVAKSTSDWILFIDQDTILPADALPRLLALKKPFVGCVYYHREAPHKPLMYEKSEYGRYMPIHEFERGALMPVDACGMGATLIHREVFQAIADNYRRFIRSDNGALILVHQDDIRQKKISKKIERKPGSNVQTYPNHGTGLTMAVPLEEIEPEALVAWEFPFYDMHDGRTEDFPFCERAIRVGYQPYIDTSLECEHLHILAIEGTSFRNLRNQAIIAGAKEEEG